MAQAAAKLGWKLVGGASAALAGAAARKAVVSAYRGVRKTDPPANPENPETTWAEAVGWAVLSGVIVALVRLAVQRAAARRWLKATGSLPPGMEQASA